MKQPKYYIQTFYEPREGFGYEQPIQRLNGKTYFEFAEGSYERENWGFILKESRSYDKIKNLPRPRSYREKSTSFIMKNKPEPIVFAFLFVFKGSSLLDGNNVNWKVINGEIIGKRAVWTHDFRVCWLEDTTIENVKVFWHGKKANYQEEFKLKKPS